MSAPAASKPPPACKRRWALGVAAGLVALLLLLFLAAQYLLQPRIATGLILREAGKSLGLDISADGEPELQLRGTPRMVVRKAHVRLPGTDRELLRAERILLSLPWSTLKSRGRLLDVERVELDAPVLDLTAFAEWQKSRPPGGEQRLPALTRGLRVVRGQVLGQGWRVDGIGIELAHFAQDHTLAGHLTGRYAADALQLPFDMHLALSKPARSAALGLAGEITPTARDWRMPMRIRVSAPMHLSNDGLRLQPAKLAAHVRYESSNGDPIPLAVGAFGNTLISSAGLDWPALALAVRGEGVVPNLDARGLLQAREKLRLGLVGRIHAWPDSFPPLPAPLSASRSPLPFSLDYEGAFDFSDIVALGLRRDATRFDGRLRVRDVLAWRDAAASGSPLPPIDGHLVTPRLDIAGAELEGVEVNFDEPSIAAPEATP